MKKVTFKGLDPEDMHTCQHCQHSFHDIGMNRKVCARSGQPIAPMDYIEPKRNDNVLRAHTVENDARRHKATHGSET